MMHASLREPILTHQPMVPDDEVVAALSAEVIWLCRSGELDQLYRVYPDFNTRTLAMEGLIGRRRMHSLAQKFPNRQVRVIVACHEHGASLVLQVMDKRGRPTPAADVLIPIRFREGLTPDGRPLPPEVEEG